MSTLSPPDSSADSASDPTTPSEPAQPSLSAEGGFDYHPMPVLVPLAFVTALLGLTGLFGVVGILLAIVAVPLSLLAWWKVRQSDGFYSGGVLSKASVGLALFGVVAGIAAQRHAYQNEVPEGAERISFNYDVSKQPLTETFNGYDVSEGIEQLEGQTVFVKGYMYPQQVTEGLPAFLLLKDTGECCFGGKPAITDMIGVKMEGDLRADHYEQTLVSVAGTFRVNRNYGRTGGGADGLEPLYQIEATHFEPARTRF